MSRQTTRRDVTEERFKVTVLKTSHSTFSSSVNEKVKDLPVHAAKA
jgi:hypothetical protein